MSHSAFEQKSMDQHMSPYTNKRVNDGDIPRACWMQSVTMHKVGSAAVVSSMTNIILAIES